MKSIKKTRVNLYILIALALIIFILVIFPNSTGAKDSSMLAVFEIDEYAQFPHLIRMLTTGDTFYQSVRNFFVYLHYFYGYPFYFFSAVVSFPIKIIFGSNWSSQTQILLTVLRQMISVLPMMVSVLIWVYLFTGFKSLWKSIAGFILLISIPAVFYNNFWWHPDSLAFLFVTLTFFSFYKDNFSFKWFFWIAALMTGFAIGTKHLGEFFVLVVPLYLLLGVIRKRLSWIKAAGLATGFIFVMILGVIISNPLLLLPIERGEIFRYQLIQWRETTQGSLVAHQSYSFTDIFHYLYNQVGGVIFLIVAVLCLFYNIIKKEFCWKYILILAWLIPYGVMIFGGSSLRSHYMIPFVIPLFAAALPLLPDFQGWKSKKLISLVVLMGLLIQLWVSFSYDISKYKQVLQREKTSESIQFYQIFQNELQTQQTELPQKVFRDWQIYIPDDAPYQVEFDWNNATYPLIKTLNPDILLLEQARIKLFSGQETGAQLTSGIDESELKSFYSDAAKGQIRGYNLIFENNFGKIFKKLNP